jgi:tetratricopeptide (TPR) repeat protein
MALVAMRQGDNVSAKRLLGETLAGVARDAPAQYRLECPLFLHNRARLHMADGDTSLAIQDLTELLASEPSNSAAYLDRGLLAQRSGRYDDALRDYDAAIHWSPPYPEPYFNRAQTLVALGRRDEARAAYDYVLTLEPNHVDARINRAVLSYELGDLEAAEADSEYMSRQAPEFGRTEEARLSCLRGLIEMKHGRFTAAEYSFTRAIEADPTLPDSWANRATKRFKQRDLDGALRDIAQSLQLRDDAAARYNRGRIYEALGQWREAIADYEHALTLMPIPPKHLLARLAACHKALRHPRSTTEAGHVRRGGEKTG